MPYSVTFIDEADDENDDNQQRGKGEQRIIRQRGTHPRGFIFLPLVYRSPDKLPRFNHINVPETCICFRRASALWCTNGAIWTPCTGSSVVGAKPRGACECTRAIHANGMLHLR